LAVQVKKVNEDATVSEVCPVLQAAMDFQALEDHQVYGDLPAILEKTEKTEFPVKMVNLVTKVFQAPMDCPVKTELKVQPVPPVMMALQVLKVNLVLESLVLLAHAVNEVLLAILVKMVLQDEMELKVYEALKVNLIKAKKVLLVLLGHLVILVPLVSLVFLVNPVKPLWSMLTWSIDI